MAAGIEHEFGSGDRANAAVESKREGHLRLYVMPSPGHDIGQQGRGPFGRTTMGHMARMFTNLAVGFLLVNWREQGILRRLGVTPLRPGLLIASQAASFSLVSIRAGDSPLDHRASCST
jgi:hypothetical protein